MKALLVSVAVLIGQMNTLQEKQVVHLQPHSGAIRADFGGKLLELQNAPAIVYLPMAPPKLDLQGNPWSLDIRNLGPGVVAVVGTSQFSLRIMVGQTVQSFGPVPQDDPTRRKPDISRAKRIRGWEPRVDFREGLKLSLEHFRKSLTARTVERVMFLGVRRSSGATP
jgi:hypothetical protein